jgi:hypothetical protein
MSEEDLEDLPVDEPQEEPPAKEWSDDEEAEAKALGWKAPDEWAGDIPAGYIDDPRRYMERAENFTPFRKERERREHFEREANERIRKIEAMNERALNLQREQIEAQMRDIDRRKYQAVETGDTDTYKQLDAQQRQLGQTMQEPRQPEGPPQPSAQDKAIVDKFRAENAWAQDPVIWDVAVRGTVKPGNETKSVAELLVEAEQAARSYFPHKFETPKPPQRGARVDGGGLAGGSKKGAFASLPADAKSAYKRFVSQGLFTDDDKGREQYAAEYNAI